MMISEIAFSNMPVLLKNAGIEFCILDCEHGGFDYAEVSRLIMTARLCGLELIVRLANNERKDVVKYLDMGADGLLLPMTNTAEDIRKVADYAKYPPLGHRGISTMRAHTLYAPPPVLAGGNARRRGKYRQDSRGSRGKRLFYRSERSFGGLRVPRRSERAADIEGDRARRRGRGGGGENLGDDHGEQKLSLEGEKLPLYGVLRWQRTQRDRGIW